MRRVTVVEAERAERRAVIGQRPMAFGRHKQSAGTVCVRPQLAKPARVSPGDRPTYPSVEGLQLRAERRAAPKPAHVPSGDRPTYPSVEGLH